MYLFVAISGGQGELLITAIPYRTILMGGLSRKLFLLALGCLRLEHGLVGSGFGELGEEVIGVSRGE